MAAILRDSTVVVAVVVVRMRPRAIPLAMTTMRKSTRGFPFVSHMRMGLRLLSLSFQRETKSTYHPVYLDDSQFDFELAKFSEMYFRPELAVSRVQR